MSKTQSEWKEYFFDMGYYWTETEQPQKILDCRNKFGNMPAFKIHLRWLDKGIAKANIENHIIKEQ
jgi:hypothetical protein